MGKGTKKLDLHSIQELIIFLIKKKRFLTHVSGKIGKVSEIGEKNYFHKFRTNF